MKPVLSNKQPGSALKYKSFKDTFKFCSFALALGLIYPNRTNVKKRVMLFSCVLLLNCPTVIWFMWYLIQCIVEQDMLNSTRNITVGVVLLLFVFKSFYSNWNTEMFAQLLEQISKDLLKGNDMDEKYHEIYDYYITQGKIAESMYAVIPVFMASQYPLCAGASMIYASTKSDDFKKHMVHDMDLKFIEDKQYDFPYFELLFAYHTLSCIMFVPNYAGFDCSFCIGTIHLRLKLKLMVHGIQRAFSDSKNISELRVKLNNCIRDHQEALQFYYLFQKLYGVWLFAVFMVTSILISCNLYQIYLSGINLKYIVCFVSGVLHIYMPCHYASCLTKLGEEISTDIYCTKWESWADPAINRILTFMIARAQKELQLTGFGIVVYKMETFVSMMQTSYSFFTLITSNK